MRSKIKAGALRALLNPWILDVRRITDSTDRCNRIAFLYSRWIEIIDSAIFPATPGEVAAFFERDMKDVFVEFLCAPHRSELLEYVNTEVVKEDYSLSPFSDFINETFVTPRSLGGFCAGLIKHLVDKDNIANLPLSPDVKNIYFT
jgi:hypothetical protein